MTGKTVEYTVLFSSIDDVTIVIVPPHAQAIGSHPHELALGAESFEIQHELQREEDHRTDGRSADLGVPPLTHLRTKARSSFCPTWRQKSSSGTAGRDDVQLKA